MQIAITTFHSRINIGTYWGIKPKTLADFIWMADKL